MILDKTPTFGYVSKSRFKNYDDRMNIHELDGLPNDLKKCSHRANQEHCLSTNC